MRRLVYLGNTTGQLLWSLKLSRVLAKWCQNFLAFLIITQSHIFTKASSLTFPWKMNSKRTFLKRTYQIVSLFSCNISKNIKRYCSEILFCFACFLLFVDKANIHHVCDPSYDEILWFLARESWELLVKPSYTMCTVFCTICVRLCLMKEAPINKSLRLSLFPKE